VNLSASEVLGTDASQFVGRDLSEAFRHFAGEDLPNRIGETAYKGGHLRFPSVPYDIGNRSGMLEINAFQIAEGSMAMFLSDVTERHRAETQIRQMAFHDELTELPNRKLFLDRLEVALAGARRRKSRVALLFLDLDDFKPVNDSFGHAFGDRLLRAVAERLSSLARASDTVARLGGDEFTVLIPDIEDDSQLEAIANKYSSAFQEPFRVDAEEVTISASIGVAATRNGTTNAATLFEHADMAMYRVKRAGRDGCAFYTSRV
jgi:diguanylate cyclase (GGDEF)-like protein